MAARARESSPPHPVREREMTGNSTEALSPFVTVHAHLVRVFILLNELAIAPPVAADLGKRRVAQADPRPPSPRRSTGQSGSGGLLRPETSWRLMSQALRSSEQT